jgi:hypothetical protein
VVAGVTIRFGSFTISGITRDRLPLWRLLAAQQGLPVRVVR